MLKEKKRMKTLAKNLRSAMTAQERHLWYDFLRQYPQQFKRQKVVEHYILDFYCHKARLAIELDGSQHYEDEAIEYDEARTKFLNTVGIEVMRFTNIEITRDFYMVCTVIDETVKKRIEKHPHQLPPTPVSQSKKA